MSDPTWDNVLSLRLPDGEGAELVLPVDARPSFLRSIRTIFGAEIACSPDGML